MLMYWIIFSIPVFFALIEGLNNTRNKYGYRKLTFGLAQHTWVFILTIFIGLRAEVGGDWLNYFIIFQNSADLPLYEIISDPIGDPLYMFVNWFAASYGLSYYFVNIFSALIFSIGLVYFCQNLPRPWLGLAIAFPYLVIVVSMGYTRQAMALGFVMIGYVALGRQKNISFLFWILMAVFSHKSAILMLPIAGLAASKNRISVFFSLVFLVIAGYFIFLQEHVDKFMYGYIELAYQSEGALIRLMMNAIPAFIMILFYKSFPIPLHERRLWFWVGIISLGLLSIFPVFPSSAALDRVALYLLPIQMVTFTYLADIFPRDKQTNTLLRFFIIAYFILVQFVWLNFASNSSSWLPYNNVLYLPANF